MADHADPLTLAQSGETLSNELLQKGFGSQHTLLVVVDGVLGSYIDWRERCV